MHEDPNMIIVVCMFLCLKVLAQSTTNLLNLDRSFKIELAWLASGAYQALAGVVNSSILKCLPNIDSHVTLAQSRAKLLNLKEDMLYKMASRQSQSAVDSMASVVSKMLVGVPPPRASRLLEASSPVPGLFCRISPSSL